MDFVDYLECEDCSGGILKPIGLCILFDLVFFGGLAWWLI